MVKGSNAAYLKRLRAAAVARGLCYVCRCRVPRPGVRTCDDCLERGRRDKSKGAGLESRRRHGRASNARRRAKRAALGLCRCGRWQRLAGYAACSVCLDYTAEATRRSLRERNGSTREPSCTVCGKTGHNKRRHARPGVLP